MASNFRMQRPYALASLPRSLNHATHDYVVGEVFGQVSNGKRRRPELIVGINGEAASLFDVSSGRLLTSYPVPPNEVFSCAPCARRLRSVENRYVSRFTYAATQNGPRQKLTVFKDVIDTAGNTSSTSSSVNLHGNDPVLFVGTTTLASEDGSDSNMKQTPPEALLAVRTNGEVQCRDAEKLTEQWSESAFSATQELLPELGLSTQAVEYTTLVSTKSIAQRPAKELGAAYSLLVESKRLDDLEADSLLMITKSTSTSTQRFLIILARTTISVAASQGGGRKLVPLYAAPLSAAQEDQPVSTAYQVDPDSRRLMELSDESVFVYDFSGAIPQFKQSLPMPNATSLLRLSRHSFVAATPSSINIFNPQYRSVNASVSIDQAALQIKSPVMNALAPCQAVAFFKRLNTIVCLIGNILTAVQLEGPLSHGTKRRAEGLLIDSIGRGFPQDIPPTKKRSINRPAVPNSTLVPGSLSVAYTQELALDMENTDKALVSGDLVEFEKILATKFGMAIQPLGGTSELIHKNVESDSSELPEWVWPKSQTEYHKADRRWVLYAISRTFSLETSDVDKSGIELRVELPQGNVALYLVAAGHLTMSNIKAAFRGELFDHDMTSALEIQLAEDLLNALLEIDPTMALLLSYLSATRLGENELLVAIREFLRSLDLIQGTKSGTARLLEGPSQPANGDDDEGDIAMQLDQLEQELQAMESYLGDESSNQVRGLTIAFAKLGACPAVATVKAMRLIFQPHEVLSLIYVLRMELVRGGWTSKYIEPLGFGDGDSLDAPPDETLSLVADLIARCLDTLGPSGWLRTDAASHGAQGDAGSVLTALRLEVSAALEGTEEAERMGSFVREMVGFAATAKSTQGGNATLDVNKPIILRAERAEDLRLPFGSKPLQQRIAPTKVVSGGEVVKRTKREKGHLISRQVQPYTLERLAI